MKAIKYVSVAAVLFAGGIAAAQESGEPGDMGDPRPARRDPGTPDLQTRIGMGLEAGGGVGGFIGDTASNITSVQGQWQARMVFGTRRHIAGEAAYVGSAQGIQALGVSPNSVLTGNGGEALARFNLLTGEWQPYAAAGVGFMYYSLGGAQLATSDLESSGTAATFPLGVGMAWRRSGIILDGRVSFHPATNTGVIHGANFSTWDVNAKAGFEF